ncbi:ankyrin repeat domain-containing protein [uncultured Treponema sp.]|uniref:ankyrin repeat domain-containing protein n=1 Tax=uncultured Treponema sp. TaxID=162155 RepID=UPI002806104E|nr:ankyrin repeat domain-containing protein [uncultured Treponema sp.]
MRFCMKKVFFYFIASLAFVCVLNGCASTKKTSNSVVQPESPAAKVEENIFIDSNGNTPLMIAIQKNQIDTVKKELSDSRYNDNNNALLNHTNINDETALHIAVRNRSEAIVKLLLDNRIEKDTKNFNGDTALHIATKNGDITIVKMLVDAKCDINAVDGNSATALVLAAKIGNKNLVDYFLEKGADIQKPDFYGKTYKDYYAPDKETEKRAENPVEEKRKISIGNTAGRKYAVVFGSSKDPVIQAVKDRNRSKLESLIAEGQGLDTPDSFGNTALMYAVNMQNVYLINCLLTNGANASASNIYGQTPLHCAVSKLNASIVSMLCSAGAEINAFDNDRNSPLVVAIKFRSPKIMSNLLDLGADPYIRFNGNNALTYICSNDDCDMARIFLNKVYSFDINWVNENGQTALDIAKERKNISLQNLLESKM